MNQYQKNAGWFKALADPTRLEIVDMLSRGELCACKILERFNITQPTLSHHMKILCDSELVTGRKEGKWTYYSLDNNNVNQFKEYLSAVTAMKNNCVRSGEECDCE